MYIVLSNTISFVHYTGPDPPNISVPKVVVTGVHQNVRISCTVQETASVDENSQFELKWTFVSERLHIEDKPFIIQHVFSKMVQPSQLYHLQYI